MLKARSQRVEGFTLVELIVTVAIAGILFAMAFPSFSTFIANGRVKNTALAIQSTLQEARAEAIKRNAPVEFALFSKTDYTDAQVNGALGINNTGPNAIVRLCDVINKQYEHVDWYNAYEGSGRASGATDLPTVINANIQNKTGSNACNADLSDDPAITFNGIGGTQLSEAATFDVTSPVSGTRALRVVISVAGTVKLCDPAIHIAGDPRTCP